MQLSGRFFKQRFLRTEATLDVLVKSNKIRTDQFYNLFVPYRTLDTKHSYGLFIENSFGSDFFYNRSVDTNLLLSFHNRNYKLFYSHAWRKADRVFVTGLLEINDVERGSSAFRRAFDNTGRFLLTFSSISEEYMPVTKLNTYITEDMMVGGYGGVTLGKTFSYGNGGESLYYVGIIGEQSYYKNDLYLFAHVSAASGFERSNSKYTYQEFRGNLFYRLNENSMITSRLRQQSVWRWSGLRQLILDNDEGLRGFAVNSFSGDNRIIFNTEYRYFPKLSVWVLDLSGVAFVDGGTTWNRGTDVMSSQFKWSTGVGLRFHNAISSGETSIFRLDFAYNATDGKFGGIVFSTNQLFSAFSMHNFRLPEILGIGFDAE